MTAEQTFYTYLTALAKAVPGFEWDEDFIETYVRLLKPHGYENVNRALEAILLERNSRDPFPSLKEIISKINPSTDPEIEAQEAASRILEAVSKDGHTNWERAKGRMGELAWSAIGGHKGYVELCENITDRNQTTYRAQLRDLCRAKFKRAALGLTDAPALPAPERKSEGLTGFGNLMKQIEEKKP